MTTTSRETGLVHGWRSGLEEKLGDQLSSQGVPVVFEKLVIPWRVEKDCTYRPDFLLPNGIIVESKGRFVTQDRQKHVSVREQHPDLDIRFVFSRSTNKISKTSKTTYGMWSAKNGFIYADKLIPIAWIDAPTNMKSLRAVRELFALNGQECPF